MEFGPSLPISKEIHASKYRAERETFKEAMTRVADTLADDMQHFRAFRDILLEMKFMPAGRVQAAVGSPRRITPINCFVSGEIDDSMASIMQRATEAAYTMRMGGGIGYDFSRIRPRGERIVSLDSRASGPVSFMGIYNAVCNTIASAGHRRGAQMAVLRVDHPDIQEFIRSKQNTTALNAFNISVGITDDFMRAVEAEASFDLAFNGRTYDKVNARALFDEIMRSTWSWAEPGVLFLDRINEMNNLWYCEKIAATNPCAEQPLPPYGACLLGSFNLAKYIIPEGKKFKFDFGSYATDIAIVIRAMDNIIDDAVYPLEEQKTEEQTKRRMGIGVTGLANAAEAIGTPYGSPKFLRFQEWVLTMLRNEAYRTSAILAKEKGAFPAFDKEKYVQGKFIQTLPDDIKELIQGSGIRNSHLLSIAPTGTISLAADNVSSGIEPVFRIKYNRTIATPDGNKVEEVMDYGKRMFGVDGKTADQVTADEHLNVLATAYKYVDSAVSKTCNVPSSMPWEDFEKLYIKAWKMGCKGLSTFQDGGERKGILNAAPVSEENQGAACYYDPETGVKSCE